MGEETPRLEQQPWGQSDEDHSLISVSGIDIAVCLTGDCVSVVMFLSDSDRFQTLFRILGAEPVSEIPTDAKLGAGSICVQGTTPSPQAVAAFPSGTRIQIVETSVYMGRDTVQFGKQVPMFLRSLPPPTAGYAEAAGYLTTRRHIKKTKVSLYMRGLLSPLPQVAAW
jgi:hypothetical protein